jgi:hypothetical protein
MTEAIKAGRELDFQIAIKLMGWTSGPLAPGVEPGPMHHLVPPNFSGGEAPKVPHYSTDIAAAWLAMDKLCELRGNDLALERHSGGWSVMSEAGEHGTELAGAQTAPHAICLAALKALAKEV